ncbi:hypothetical protein Tco_0366740 [Tanacetum coccineum]
MEEMLAKFIDEGRHEHEEMEIFIKEFRTTNELLLKTRSNLLSDMKIKEKPHDDGEKNKSSSIYERTTQPLVKPQQSSIPFPNRVRKEKEEALQRNFLENLKQLDINISFIEALVQLPKYAKYLKSLLTNKSRLKEACTETMNERCSVVLLNELPLKEKDPRSFTIPCQVLEKHTEAENLTADHLSRSENPHIEVLIEREITDKFPDDHLMVLKSKFNDDEPIRGDKDFKVGDKVLLYNYRLKMYPGKLKSKWSGPNIVKTVYPHRAIEITDKDGFSFKVNGQRLKKYYGGNIEKEDDEVIEFENGVT